MTRITRGLFIAYVVLRFGLDAILFESMGAKRWARWLARGLRFGRRFPRHRAHGSIFSFFLCPPSF